jgi:chromosome partitioning protein
MIHVSYVMAILHVFIVTHGGAMTKVYAVANQKGGTGKTNTAINIAAALAEDEQANVLLIDLDPQGHGTEGCGARDAYNQEGPSLFDALIPASKPGRARTASAEAGIDVSKLIQPLPNERFFLIPGHYNMLLAEQTLTPVTGREYRLDLLIEATGEVFSHIVIDCPPNLGVLTDNAINAARRGRGGLIIPVQAEPSSIRALELLLDQVQSIEAGLKIQVDKLAVVPNLVQDSRLGRDILAGLRANIDVTLPFNIPKRIVLQEAYGAGRSIFTYAPKELAKRVDVEELRKLYRQLATIVNERSDHRGQ